MFRTTKVQVALLAAGIGIGAFYMPWFFKKYLSGDIDVPDEKTELPMTVPKIVKREMELQHRGVHDNKRMHHFDQLGLEDKVAGWDHKPEIHRLVHETAPAQEEKSE